ncbi:MAG: hypothetical protein GWO07_08655 [Candidatus Dadabacteria bacterium]|nr:hypothetical protein [Candidatus Dadabacteria bacterium]NIS08817.1 hypothetical protein [Candidatus Dadabacteria bacterium]NIY22167.1 hypothetical protein [Candidatus Dadabacteria bacterium]
MKFLWQNLTNLFSYLFMSSAFAGCICSFYLVIFYLKDVFGNTTAAEAKIAKQLFIILLFCIVIFPISFYISHTAEKKSAMEDKYDYTK